VVDTPFLVLFLLQMERLIEVGLQYASPVVMFFLAFFLSLGLVPLIIGAARKWDLFDQPDQDGEGEGRKIHAVPVPRLGGVAIFLAFVITNILIAPQHNYWGYILPTVLIFLVALLDDLRGLSAKLRLFIQVVVAAATVGFFDLTLEALMITNTIDLPLPIYIGFPLSVFIIVGAINATNMVDGLDGLAGGLVLIAFSLLGYQHYMVTLDPSYIYFFTLPLAGAIFGFLRYNTYPASIFMGDSGSNWLGMMTGIALILALKLPAGTSDALPAVAVLLPFAIPILDTFFVMVTRIARGGSPVIADQLHLHHNLLKAGFSHPQTVTLIYFIALVLGVTGILPVIFPRYVSWIVPYMAPIAFIGILYYLLKKEGGEKSVIPFYQILIRSTGISGKRVESFFKGWEKINQYTIYTILLITPIITGGTQLKPVGYLSGVALLILGLFYLLKKQGFTGSSDLLHAFFLSAGSVLLLASNNAKNIVIIMYGQRHSVHDIYNAIFIVLAISTILFLLFTFRKKYLIITPTDFLLVSMPMLILLLPDVKNQYSEIINIVAIRSLVLFTAIRTLVRSETDFGGRLQMIIMISLLYLFLTGALGMKVVY